jgi:hypothetical protein
MLHQIINLKTKQKFTVNCSREEVFSTLSKLNFGGHDGFSLSSDQVEETSELTKLEDILSLLNYEPHSFGPVTELRN